MENTLTSQHYLNFHSKEFPENPKSFTPILLPRNYVSLVDIGH